jgi:xanthine dehydrogenase accessory factor
MNYNFPKLLETLAGGQGLVLATIVAAEGSTPQVVGASAIFSAAGLVAGTVGGGLLEARVEAVAREALGDLTARLVSIRLDADPSDMEGAICGGTARVLVDPEVERYREVFRQALDAIRGRGSGHLAVGMEPVEGDRVAVKRLWIPFAEETALKSGNFPPVPLGFSDRNDRGRQGEELGLGRYIYAEYVQPLPRLVIAGAGHVGKAVARMGRLLDFAVTVIDDRAEFANADNLPDADTIILADIGEAVRTVEESADDYYVIVTRGHRKDAEALRAVFVKPAVYVGMIGSRNKIEVMRREFLGKGWATAEEWARVRAPIGLEIGSRTVDEIAVSIAAELVLVRSRRKAEGLA